MRWRLLAILVAVRLAAGEVDRPADGNVFLTALRAQPDGSLWVGTEEHGAWLVREGRVLAVAGTAQGLPPAVSAIAIDTAGRVWLGFQRGGAAVLANGRWTRLRWHEGALGDRVWDIAAAADGGVWLASDAGLARWDAKQDSWRWWTAADGLPGDGVHRIAVDSQGTCWAGTLTQGLYRFDPEGREWRVGRAGVGPPEGMTSSARGRGLPSSCITGLMVLRDGAIVVATDLGCALSRDRGASWSFVRGQEWAQRLRGRTIGAPAGWSEQPASGLLGEDYCCSLAEGADGALWVGHWRALPDRVDPATLVATPCADPRSAATSKVGDCDYPSAIQVSASGAILAMYGGGLASMGRDGSYRGGMLLGALVPPVAPAFPAVVARPPSPAPASERWWRELPRQLAQVAAAAPGFDGAATLPDDWSTRGDWLGRYGRHFAVLAAIRAPEDYVWGCGYPRLAYHAWLGPHQRRFLPDAYGDGGDVLRHWIQFLQGSHPRHLELPPAYARQLGAKTLSDLGGFRRQAEWDDHAEAYPLTHEGPNVYCDIALPTGDWALSFYQVNKDGHGGANLHRHYRYTLLERRPGGPEIGGRDLSGAEAIASSGVKDFWGGVWKRHLVRGPRLITIELARLRSFNTVWPGIMVDRWDPVPRPYVPRAQRMPQAGKAWQELDALRTRNPAAWSGWMRLAAAEVYRQGDRVSAADRFQAAFLVADWRQWEAELGRSFGIIPREADWAASEGLPISLDGHSGEGIELVMGWLERTRGKTR
jgi:hypothetical protein